MESVIEIFFYIFWVVLAITILVFVHEMGHFLFAKLFKMRVERFSVGFPPKLLSKQIGETEYMIGATPLGGYVKISGMVDESMDSGFAESEPEPWEFRSKPVWQRIVVITAGVIFNVLLAFVIFTGLKLAYGETYIPAEQIEEVYVTDGSLAHKMGLRTGDRILEVGGKELERYGDLQGLEALLADPMTITVLRDGQRLTFEGPPDIMTQLNRSGGTLGISVAPAIVGGVMSGTPADEAGLRPADRIVAIGGEPIEFWLELTEEIQASEGRPIPVRWQRPDTMVTEASTGLAQVVEEQPGYRVYEAVVAPRKTGDRYMLGISDPTAEMLGNEFGVRHQRHGVGSAVAAGMQETWLNMNAIVTSLTRVFTGRENFRENVGGPIMIAKVTKQAAEAGARIFWNIVAVLSITLAIINILPIPALDGGHLMFLIYEGITRREPSLKVRMVMQQVGMILLLAFMTFLIFNDILRL